MYYQNGNYMQDLNYYNQNPAYNPYANQFQNQTFNPQIPMGQMPMQNLNAMYPAIYRIISPVVSQVLASNQGGYLTEESLNHMVDTVYNIVEGDINLGAQATSNMPNSSNENSNASNCERNSSTSRQNSASTATSNTNAQNALLRDLIKIMILNEMSNQRQTMQNPMMMQNQMPNTNMTQGMYR